MSDHPFGAFVPLLDHLGDRRRALHLAASGLGAARLASALELGDAKKKRKHKRKKKHKKPLSLAERCFATCGATCDACFFLVNESLLCGDTASLSETPCTTNSACDDPLYPSCMLGAVNRADGAVDAYGDVEGVCAIISVPCE
jgi:hypothetical protein